MEIIFDQILGEEISEEIFLKYMVCISHGIIIEKKMSNKYEE